MIPEQSLPQAYLQLNCQSQCTVYLLVSLSLGVEQEGNLNVNSWWMHPGKHLLVALGRNMASLVLYDFLALTLALHLGHGIV